VSRAADLGRASDTFHRRRIRFDYSYGGLILVRKLDERLGLSELVARYLSDSRLMKIPRP
jgi:hypothetical protein